MGVASLQPNRSSKATAMRTSSSLPDASRSLAIRILSFIPVRTALAPRSSALHHRRLMATNTGRGLSRAGNDAPGFCKQYIEHMFIRRQRVLDSHHELHVWFR